MAKFSVLFLIVLLSLPAYGADLPFEFANTEQELRYQNLIEELRCLVCQNQSLADSNADLAQDLREEVYEQLNKGLSDKDIISFLVSRYGDFVLYRPPLNQATWLLWFGPFLLLLIGIVVVMRLVRNNDGETREALTDSQKKLAESLLSKKDEGVS